MKERFNDSSRYRRQLSFFSSKTLLITFRVIPHASSKSRQKTRWAMREYEGWSSVILQSILSYASLKSLLEKQRIEVENRSIRTMILRGLPRTVGSNIGVLLSDQRPVTKGPCPWGASAFCPRRIDSFTLAHIQGGRTFKLFINSQVICKIWLSIVLGEFLALNSILRTNPRLRGLSRFR